MSRYELTTLGLAFSAVAGAGVAGHEKSQILAESSTYQAAKNALEAARNSPDSTTIAQLEELENALRAAYESIDFGIWNVLFIAFFTALFASFVAAMMKPSRS